MGEFDTGVTGSSPAPSSSVQTSSAGVTAESPTAEGTTGVTAESPTASNDTTATNLGGHQENVPYERFAEANRRAKQAEQAARQWQEAQTKFGDLSRVDPGVYRAAMDLAGQLRTDPVSAVTQLLQELSGNDLYRGPLASQAARVLNGLRGSQPKEEPEPQPDLMAENGDAVFSARQLRAWNEWNQRKVQGDLEQRLNAATAPLRELQHEREVAKVQQHAQSVASKMYDRAKTWPGFVENQGQVKAAWEAHPDWTLQDAYIHVLSSDILPKLPQQAQAKVVADLQQRAAAQTLNPSGASAPASPDFKGDFGKALEFFGKRK